MLGRDTDVTRLRPEDFAAIRAELAVNWSLKTLSKEIGRIRAYFNYAWKAGLLDSPVKGGMAFDKPSMNSLKREIFGQTRKDT